MQPVHIIVHGHKSSDLLHVRPRQPWILPWHSSIGHESGFSKSFGLVEDGACQGSDVYHEEARWATVGGPCPACALCGGPS